MLDKWHYEMRLRQGCHAYNVLSCNYLSINQATNDDSCRLKRILFSFPSLATFVSQGVIHHQLLNSRDVWDGWSKFQSGLPFLTKLWVWSDEDANKDSKPTGNPGRANPPKFHPWDIWPILRFKLEKISEKAEELGNLVASISNKIVAQIDFAK